MMENGVHHMVVSERLGHSDSSITLNVYTHVAPTTQKDAALDYDKAMEANRKKRVPKVIQEAEELVTERS